MLETQNFFKKVTEVYLKATDFADSFGSGGLKAEVKCACNDSHRVESEWLPTEFVCLAARGRWEALSFNLFKRIEFDRIVAA